MRECYTRTNKTRSGEITGNFHTVSNDEIVKIVNTQSTVQFFSNEMDESTLII
jgi:hypothetical protein